MYRLVKKKQCLMNKKLRRMSLLGGLSTLVNGGDIALMNAEVSQPVTKKIKVNPGNQGFQSHAQETTTANKELLKIKTRGQETTEAGQQVLEKKRRKIKKIQISQMQLRSHDQDMLLREHSKYRRILRNLKRIFRIVVPLVNEYRGQRCSDRKTKSQKSRFESLNKSVAQSIADLTSKKGLPLRFMKELNDSLDPLRVGIVISPEKIEFQSESENITKLLVCMGYQSENTHYLHFSTGIEEIVQKMDRLLTSVPTAERSRTELTVYNLAHGTKTRFGFDDNPIVNRNTFLQRIDECCNIFERPSQVVLAECHGHEFDSEDFKNITIHALSTSENPITVSFADLHVDLEYYI